MSALDILIDPEQDRLIADMLCTLVWDWDIATADGLWVDPVTNTAMLNPAAVLPHWNTDDGTHWPQFAKYAKADYLQLVDGTGTDVGSAWADHMPDAGGAFLKFGAGPSGAPDGNPHGLYGVMPIQPVNGGMVVEFYHTDGVPGVGGAGDGVGTVDTGIFWCGWLGSDNDLSAFDLSLKFCADGRVRLFRGAAYLAEYSLGANRRDDQPRDRQVQRAIKGFTKAILLPCRDRELLVYSPSEGGGFSHPFDHLAEDLGGQTITPGSKFFFYIPPGIFPGGIRIAPCRFANHGVIRSTVSGWRVAPRAGLVAETRLYQDRTSAEAGGGLTTTVEVLTEGLPNPYAIPNPVALRASVAGGDGTRTPFLYGARATYPAEVASTASSMDGPVSVLDFAKSVRIEVHDQMAGVSVEVVLHRPDALALVGAPDIGTQCGRPFLITDDEGPVVLAIGEAPLTQEAWGATDEDRDAHREVAIRLRDNAKRLEEFRFVDPLPLDGMSLLEAYTTIVGAVGLTAVVSGDADHPHPGSPEEDAGLILLPMAGTPTHGRWNTLIRTGDTALEWLERLHRTYVPDWAHTIDQLGRPTLLAASDMPATLSVTLFASVDEAIDGGVDADLASRRVYRSVRRQVLAPEANDIWVIGLDPRTWQPLLAHYQDEDSVDPAVDPGLRPPNWLGGLVSYAYGDPGITTQALADRCCARIAKRVAVAREIIEFTCEYLDGVWRGDLVCLKGAIDGEDRIVRIKTLSCDFEQVDESAVWRPARYVGEVGDLVCPLGVRGVSTRAILQGHNLQRVANRRLYREVMEKGGWGWLSMSEIH